jgi:hypothetical protein
VQMLKADDCSVRTLVLDQTALGDEGVRAT